MQLLTWHGLLVHILFPRWWNFSITIYYDLRFHPIFSIQAGLMLLCGKILTIAPAKIVYLISIFLFEVGSLICALSPSANILIFGRVVCGIGAAGLWIAIMSLLARVRRLMNTTEWIMHPSLLILDHHYSTTAHCAKFFRCRFCNCIYRGAPNWRGVLRYTPCRCIIYPTHAYHPLWFLDHVSWRSVIDTLMLVY